MPMDSLLIESPLPLEGFNDQLSYLVNIAIVSVVVPFFIWVGGFFKKDPDKEWKKQLMDNIGFLGTVIQKLDESIKKMSNELNSAKEYLDHIHDDVNKLRAEDPNMTKGQVIKNAHFYFDFYSKYLSSEVDKIISNYIIGEGKATFDLNLDKITKRLTSEHLEVFRRLKNMLETLYYRDRNMGDFADDDLRDHFRYMATYVLGNLSQMADGDVMDEENLDDYYDNWRSKIMSLFLGYLEKKLSFKDQMKNDPDWAMGSPSNHGEVEFLGGLND